MALAVQYIETEAEFFTLEAEWTELQTRSSQATIFSSYDWARVCWENRAQHIHPCILKFFDDGKLVGIAPFCRHTPPLRPSKLLPMGMGDPRASVADYLDVLAASGYEEAVVSAMLAFFAANVKLWDVLDWQQLSEASLSYQALVQMAPTAGFPMLMTKHSVCHTIPLPETWKAYLDGLSGNMRTTIERKTRKFMRECDGSIRQVTDEEDLDRMLTIFLAFQQQRWDPAFARQRETFNQFSRKLARSMLRRGWLDMNILLAGTTPVAIIWSFRFHATIYFYLSAFDQDEQWNKYSVGTILLANCIKQAIEDGYRTFDLMRGNYGYKTRFASTPYQNYRVRIFRTSALQRSYQLSDSAKLLKRRLQQEAKQVARSSLHLVNKLSDYARRDSAQVHHAPLE